MVYCNNYVDMNLLEKGIYYSNKPFLYSKETTIDDIIQHVESVMESTGITVDEDYFVNLKQCQLIDVVIKLN